LKPFERRPIRAPKSHGSILIDPPLEQVGALLEANAACQGRCDYDISGRRLGALAADARQQLVKQAFQYSAQYRDVGPLPTNDRVLLAGHQPQLFHPGVWFKNFVLGSLAAGHGTAAVNLVVDSDTIKSTRIRVPAGSLDEPIVQSIAFDAASEAIPFEERTILDRAKFEAFGRCVDEMISPLVDGAPDDGPLVREFWPLVLERSRETSNLGECLAQARHQLEGRWGLSTLEFPQSRVCQLEPFHWFAAHLLGQLPRWAPQYNESVAEYRRAYRIRSVHHPVADLARDGDWHEAPLWIWSAQSPKRRKLFVRQRQSELQLTDRAGWELTIPWRDGDAGPMAAALAELPGQGIRLRTRALATTIFARLFLGNLFLHGIGGGKYDELTDRLIARWFGFEPPGFLVISATLHLPVTHLNVTADDLRRVDHLLRELTYNPDRAIESDDRETLAAIAQKQAAIGTERTRANARWRTGQIRAANEQLQPLVAARREQLIAERDSIVRQLRAEAVWSSREYAFCLYPEKSLRNFMLAFPASTA
jgi:hypothetical protein